MTGWVEETLHGDLHIKLRADKVLYDSDTEHQRLVIFENATFGRVMALDGVMQTTEADEFIYHEMLAHLPIAAHGRVRKVLIIGGGDGGMLEEVLKHRAVEKVTMVDIDDTVVELAKRYTVFVKDCQERYDLIIVDSTDPIGPGEVLFTQQFYSDCKACLAEGGVIVTQNGVPFLQGGELTGTLTALRPLFADAACYLATVPTYVGGPMAFGWASDDSGLRQVDLETLRKRWAEAGIETRYYTPEVHLAAFALPPYIAELIA
jgi:spermidine synthase